MRIILPLIFTVSLLAQGTQRTLVSLIDAPNAPTDSPGAGTYGSTQSVTLSDPTAQFILYTTTGTPPACPATGTLYSGAFNISVTTTLKAVGCNGITGGGILTSIYTISGATVQCGANQTDHTNSDNGDNNLIVFMKCTTGANVNGYGSPVVKVFINAAAGGGNLQAAIYTESGGVATTEVCHSASVAVTASSLNSITPATCGTLAPSTIYWIGVNNDTASINYGTSVAACTGSGGTNQNAGKTFGSWGTLAATTANCNYEVYIVANVL